MKFLVDMGISPKSVFYLRKLLDEAVHLHELGLDRLSDVDILMPVLKTPPVFVLQFSTKPQQDRWVYTGLVPNLERFVN